MTPPPVNHAAAAVPIQPWRAIDRADLDAAGDLASYIAYQIGEAYLSLSTRLPHEASNKGDPCGPPGKTS